MSSTLQEQDVAEENGNREEIAGFDAPDKKVELYGWRILDQPGVLEDIPKEDLQIDWATYQRTKISKARINAIARNWSWIACGTLIVARRPDGSNWLVDGQSRKLSADKRTDILTLPCLVFLISKIKDEARGFVDLNTVRGPVKSLAKFTAQLYAEHPPACSIRDMVEGSGYVISDKTALKTVACVKRLMDCWGKSKKLTQAIWKMSVRISEAHDDARITDFMIGGLFYLESTLLKRGSDSVFDAHNHKSLVNAGPARITEYVLKAKAYFGKGGEAVSAQGIVNLVNRRRSSRRLPDIVTS